MGTAKLTQLETPPDENAIKSIESLKELVPESSFTLNRVYAPYRLGAAGRPSAGELVAPGLGCSGDRCFGTNLINWHPQAAACAKDVHIGIVDTGFDKGHPAFANTRYVDKTFAPPGSAEAPKDHGTGIFALLAGGPTTSTPGLIPNARYFFANAFYAESRGGQPISDTTEMMAALNWLIERQVTVVNLSFAGPKDPLVHFAIQEMARAGIVVVAAAGNEGPSAPPSYPAAYPEVIAVTAVDRNLAPYRYANRGAHIDVAAPGVGIWTALPGRKVGQQTGTSFAVPYVTAVLAMNHTQLEGRGTDAFAPKRRAIEVINGNIMRLGGATQRSPIFGAGLVQAPSSCPPAPGVAVAEASPSPSPSPWASSVVPASVKEAPAPAPTGWGTTTVHAVTAKGR
jgi:subtilisin family serine protease